MEAIKNRYEFVILFDVENGNPNGDPDAGNPSVGAAGSCSHSSGTRDGSDCFDSSGTADFGLACSRSFQ